MTDIGRLARERRQRKESTPPAPDGYQWGTCTGVYDVGRSRPRLVARVLLASVAMDPPDCCGIRAHVAG